MRLETTIKRYIGSSTEQKPELAQSDAGSSFMEENTGRIARWTGREWVYPPIGETETDLLHVVLERLDTLVELVDNL